jgi:hypothetical protein
MYKHTNFVSIPDAIRNQTAVSPFAFSNCTVHLMDFVSAVKQLADQHSLTACYTGERLPNGAWQVTATVQQTHAVGQAGNKKDAKSAAAGSLLQLLACQGFQVPSVAEYSHRNRLQECLARSNRRFSVRYTETSTACGLGPKASLWQVT